jgi:hypothetical protein
MAESGLSDDGGDLDLAGALVELNSTWDLILHLEECLKENPDPVLEDEKKHAEEIVLPDVQDRVYALL